MEGEQLSKLSEKIGVDISTMSRAIKVLENKNYVKRGILKQTKGSLESSLFQKVKNKSKDFI